MVGWLQRRRGKFLVPHPLPPSSGCRPRPALQSVIPLFAQAPHLNSDDALAKVRECRLSHWLVVGLELAETPKMPLPTVRDDTPPSVPQPCPTTEARPTAQAIAIVSKEIPVPYYRGFFSKHTLTVTFASILVFYCVPKSRSATGYVSLGKESAFKSSVSGRCCSIVADFLFFLSTARHSTLRCGYNIGE